VNEDVSGGPAALRDPVAQRSSFYLMYESIVEATARADGRFSQEIYLEGKLFIDWVQFTGEVTDGSILLNLAM
jgi:hypothetical protein